MTTTNFNIPNVTDSNYKDIGSVMSGNSTNTTTNKYLNPTAALQTTIGTSQSVTDTVFYNYTKITGTPTIGAIYPTNYFITTSKTDIYKVFCPIYADITSATSGTSVTIPSWCSRIAFNVIGTGGNGQADYTDAWDTLTGHTLYASGYYTYTINVTQQYDRDAFNGHHSHGCWQQQQNNTGTSYAYYNDYTHYTQNYSGSGGGGGGCIAGIYNNINGSSANCSTMTITIDTSKTNIQFNDSVSSFVTAFNGSNASPSDLSQGARDSIGTFGGTKYGYGSTNLGSVTTENVYSVTASTGKFDFVCQNSGSSGTLGVINNTYQGTGGSSGYSNSSTIQTYFLPSLSTTYGNGGNGGSSNTGTTGAVRYWFLR